MKRAIVLSGGGAKGSYEVGVWKALRKLGISYDIVTGTSIGSLNGLMMVQRDYWKCVWIWSNIGFDVMYEEEFPSKYDTLLEKTKVYKNYVKYFLKNGGISMGKAKNLVTKAYDSRKFFRSPIDFGIVTFNLTTMKPVIMKKKDFKNNVVDYVLASSCCYPAFQKMKIDDMEFIDGGYHDNMPINLAVEMGANEIIAVDLDAIGIRKRVVYPDVQVTYISPRNSLGSFLIFDKNLARRGIRYGYNDTMKVYKKLDGDKFTFHKGNLERNYERYSSSFLEKCDDVLRYGKNKSIYDSILKLTIFNRILVTRKDFELKRIFLQNLEYLGYLFGFNDSRIYSIYRFNSLLKAEILDSEEVNWDYIEDKIKKKDFKQLFNTTTAVRYLYNLLSDAQANRKTLCLLACVFPKEFIGALYLTLL